LEKTNILKYKAYYASDRRYWGLPPFEERYKGHIFSVDPVFGWALPGNGWIHYETKAKSGIVIIACSPIKIMLRDDQGRMVGSAEEGIVNEISGAKYMPPGQIGYSDKVDPSTAFELDEFIFLPDDLIGDYELIVKGTGDGEYRLLFAKFDSSAAEEYSDVTTVTSEIKENEVHKYKVSIDETINPVRIPPENEIPEFSTIAIPVAAILGLLLLFNHCKRRKQH
jgi:hypothetical protein